MAGKQEREGVNAIHTHAIMHTVCSIAVKFQGEGAMRPILTYLAGIAMLLYVGAVTPVSALGQYSEPDAAAIEKLVRDTLGREEYGLPSLLPYKNAALIEFELLSLEQVTSSHWHARIQMLFDFGLPPPSIVGFKRIRRGSYRLVLKRQDGRLTMRRFTPVGRVYLLPVRN